MTSNDKSFSNVNSVPTTFSLNNQNNSGKLDIRYLGNGLY